MPLFKSRLIPCRGCSATVSDQAYTCPNCAYPLRMTPGHKALRGCATLFVGIVLLGAVFVLGAASLIVAH